MKNCIEWFCVHGGGFVWVFLFLLTFLFPLFFFFFGVCVLPEHLWSLIFNSVFSWSWVIHFLNYSLPGAYLTMAAGIVKGSCPLLYLPDPSGIPKVKSSFASALKGTKRSFSDIPTKCPIEKCCTNLFCFRTIDTALPKHCWT